MIEIDDLFHEDKHILDPFSQTSISSRREYYINASSKDEKIDRSKLSFFKHQKLTRDILKDIDRLLVLDDTGTGKTGTVVSFTEYVEEQTRAINPDFRVQHLQKALILVKGDNQAADFEHQLTKKLSQKDKYNAGSKKGTTQKFKKFYEIRHYEEFTKEISRKGAEYFYEKYSNTIIWVDEAHNLILQKNDDGKKTSEFTLAGDKEKSYNILWDLFHNIKNSKIIFTTATPMVNYTISLTYLCNLLLPANGQIPRKLDISSLSKFDFNILFSNLPYENV